MNTTGAGRNERNSLWLSLRGCLKHERMHLDLASAETRNAVRLLVIGVLMAAYVWLPELIGR